MSQLNVSIPVQAITMGTFSHQYVYVLAVALLALHSTGLPSGSQLKKVRYTITEIYNIIVLQLQSIAILYFVNTSAPSLLLLIAVRR